jgi:hypothetical protein
LRDWKNDGRRMTGHIFKIKMIAVSFLRDAHAAPVPNVRKCNGRFFGIEMIAQS